MKLRKEVTEFEPIPKGYGLAYHQFYCAKMVIYPIPLNLIVRIGREIHLRLIRGLFKSKMEELLKKSYQKGYKEGKTDGFFKFRFEIENIKNHYGSVI